MIWGYCLFVFFFKKYLNYLKEILGTCNCHQNSKNSFVSFCGFCGLYIFLPMDPTFVGKIFLIWMLLLVTLTNSIVIKSRLHTLVFDNEPNLGMNFLPLLWGIFATIKRHPFLLWWKEPI
jgi:hypothetical protein